jgi:hypothetical protein
MKAIYKTYKKIYNKPKKYDVVGHSFHDLYLESAKINEKGVVELGIGS